MTAATADVASCWDYTPTLPCTRIYTLGSIEVTPAPYGHYAKTHLIENGWWVETWGETAEQAEENLRNYITSGSFEYDRNR